MKKRVSILLIIVLALTMVFSFAFTANAVPGEQNGNSLHIIQPAGGAYVIVTKLAPGDLEFCFGWNHADVFATEAFGYWVGVYDITNSHYMWVIEESLAEPNPKMLKLDAPETMDLVAGNEYKIVLLVRGAGMNVAEIEGVYFTAP